MFTPALPSSSVICASMPGVFLCSTQMRCTPERGIETAGKFTLLVMLPFSR